MNAIDQRILIPANPDVIWHVISNINDNPKWQVNCQHVSFLTTNHSGAGMRYRSTSPNGRDMVYEMTAWYENVGYAYTIIDGISTRSNSGRFRLQEITEGTIVQWAFEYEPSGLLGGIKNSLSTKRNFERDIVKSLENLWRVIGELQAGKKYVSRTTMREAPDVESRAQYKARHDKSPITTTVDHEALNSFLKADEPPIKEGDTRPHPASPTPPSEIAPVASEDIFSDRPSTPSSEPDFLQSLDAPSVDTDHSIFQPPAPEKVEQSLPPAVEPTPQPVETESEIESLFSFEETPAPAEPIAETVSVFTDPIPPATLADPVDDADATLTPPIEPPAEPISEPASSVEVEPETTPDPESAFKAEDRPVAVAPETEQPTATTDPASTDTSQMSIFEIFGLPKPSETQPMPAVMIADAPPAEQPTAGLSTPDTPQALPTPSTPMDNTAGALGLRVKLRRKSGKVRKRS